MTQHEMRGGYAAGLLTAAALAAACATAGVSVEEAVSLEPQGPPLAAPDAATPTDAGARTDATPGAGGGCDTPCGIDPQCGCGARETCDLDEGGARRCVAAGTAPAGRACRGTGECAPGLLCAGGVCRSPCTAVGDKCPSAGGGFCLEYARTSVDAGAGGPTHAACEVPCAYDDAGSCGFAPGDAIAAGCVYRAATRGVDCTRVRNVQLQSGVCESDAECGAARVCVPQSGYSSCRKLCKVGAPDACGGCQPLTPARVVDGKTYGACP